MTMTDDPDFLDELLSRYLDGDATDDEVARVESDPALVARAGELRAGIELVGQPVTVPTADLDRIRAAAIAQSSTTAAVTDLEHRRAEKLQRRNRFLAAAAVFVFLAVGYAANAAAAGIEISSLDISLEGDLDLHTFLGLRDGNAGYESIRVSVDLQADASAEQLAELHEKVTSTSPVGHTLSRAVPVDIQLT